MSELLIQNDRAQTTIDHSGDLSFKGLRMFGVSPETTALQIRTHGPLRPASSTVRPAFSTVNLTATDIALLILALQAEHERLTGK